MGGRLGNCCHGILSIIRKKRWTVWFPKRTIIEGLQRGMAHAIAAKIVQHLPRDSKYLTAGNRVELENQVMREEYGLYVWPSSLALAEYVWQQRNRFLGMKVLELGAGTALPGIVAAKVGALVTLTDHADQPQVFENMKRTCVLNRVDCKIQGLTWGEWDEATCTLQHQVQIILAADVLYQNEDFDDLFATVSYFLLGTPNAVFITTYQHRSGHRSLEFLLAKWGLCCTRLMDVADFMPSLKASSLPSSLQLVEIMLRENVKKYAN